MLKNKIFKIQEEVPAINEIADIYSVDGVKKIVSLGKIENLEKTKFFLKFLKSEKILKL